MADSTMTLEQELLEQVRKLDRDQQRRVMAYARALHTRPKGLSGSVFLERTKDIHIDVGDLERMEQAIEETFEGVSDVPEVRFND
ncbi:MAG: hypothetical protein CL610_20915 [Anaerolineaceae bacterium]|nr:hypothetical protein [Anaerolineaceae bacterium]